MIRLSKSAGTSFIRPVSRYTRQLNTFYSTTSVRRSGSYQIPLQIGGKDVSTPKSFAVKNPSTGKHIWDSSSSSEEDALAAVEAADKAFPAWSQTTPATRRDIFLRAADIITRRKEELGSYMNQEIGADQYYQDFILGLSIEGLKDTAGRISETTQGFVPQLMENGAHAIVYREPYGVVLGIGPW